jgi:hypothetical protein
MTYQVFGRHVFSILIVEYTGNRFFRNAGIYQSKTLYVTVILNTITSFFRVTSGKIPEQSGLATTAPDAKWSALGYKTHSQRRHLAMVTFFGETPRRGWWYETDILTNDVTAVGSFEEMFSLLISRHFLDTRLVPSAFLPRENCGGSDIKKQDGFLFNTTFINLLKFGGSDCVRSFG